MLEARNRGISGIPIPEFTDTPTTESFIDGLEEKSSKDVVIYNMNRILKNSSLHIVRFKTQDPKIGIPQVLYSLRTEEEIASLLNDSYTIRDIFDALTSKYPDCRIVYAGVYNEAHLIMKRNKISSRDFSPRKQKLLYLSKEHYELILGILIQKVDSGTIFQTKNPQSRETTQDLDKPPYIDEAQESSVDDDHSLEKQSPADEEIEKLALSKSQKTESVWETPEQIIGIYSVYEVLLNLEKGTLSKVPKDIPILLTSVVEKYFSRSHLIKGLSDVFIDPSEKRLKRFFRIYFLSTLEYWDLDPEKTTRKSERSFAQIFKALKDKGYTKEQVVEEVLVDHFGLNRIDTFGHKPPVLS